MDKSKNSGMRSRKVSAVETTTEIIRALIELDGAGVTEVAEHLGRSKGSIHSHLVTLRQERFVVKRGATYHISLELLDIGNQARHQLDIYSAAKKALSEAAEETGEYAHLVVEQHGLGYHVIKISGSQAVGTASRIGKAYPLTHTAPGKSILAFLPNSRIDSILDLHGLPAATTNSITDRTELIEELERTRHRGTAFDNEEHIYGIRSVGAPILGTDDSVKGAVSISGPRERMEAKRYQEVIPSLVKRTANYIEVSLSTGT